MQKTLQPSKLHTLMLSHLRITIRLILNTKGCFTLWSNLDAAGIHYAGAGTSLTEAAEPAIWDMKGNG